MPIASSDSTYSPGWWFGREQFVRTSARRTLPCYSPRGVDRERIVHTLTMIYQGRKRVMINQEIKSILPCYIWCPEPQQSISLPQCVLCPVTALTGKNDPKKRKPKYPLRHLLCENTYLFSRCIGYSASCTQEVSRIVPQVAVPSRIRQKPPRLLAKPAFAWEDTHGTAWWWSHSECSEWSISSSSRQCDGSNTLVESRSALSAGARSGSLRS